MFELINLIFLEDVHQFNNLEKKVEGEEYLQKQIQADYMKQGQRNNSLLIKLLQSVKQETKSMDGKDSQLFYTKLKNSFDTAIPINFVGKIENNNGGQLENYNMPQTIQTPHKRNMSQQQYHDRHIKNIFPCYVQSPILTQFYSDTNYENSSHKMSLKLLSSQLIDKHSAQLRKRKICSLVSKFDSFNEGQEIDSIYQMNEIQKKKDSPAIYSYINEIIKDVSEEEEMHRKEILLVMKYNAQKEKRQIQENTDDISLKQDYKIEQLTKEKKYFNQTYQLNYKQYSDWCVLDKQEQYIQKQVSSNQLMKKRKINKNETIHHSSFRSLTEGNTIENCLIQKKHPQINRIQITNKQNEENNSNQGVLQTTLKDYDKKVKRKRYFQKKEGRATSDHHTTPTQTTQETNKSSSVLNNRSTLSNAKNHQDSILLQQMRQQYSTQFQNNVVNSIYKERSQIFPTSHIVEKNILSLRKNITIELKTEMSEDISYRDSRFLMNKSSKYFYKLNKKNEPSHQNLGNQKLNCLHLLQQNSTNKQHLFTNK